MNYPNNDIFSCGEKINDRKCGPESKDPKMKKLKNYKFCFTQKG